MRLFGYVLVCIGAAWVVLCFLGIAMMSRSADKFTEAFLPSLLGLVLAGVGGWLISRKRPIPPA